MKVVIIGAGVSGLAAARALRAVGLDVTVFEGAPDVGGVWSAVRRYPGISLQSDKQSYAFSNAPMPATYPEYPSGAQVRQYLEAYVAAEGLTDCIRLNSRVVEAEVSPEGWRVVAETPEGRETVFSDWLVVANGLSSWSHVPPMPGIDRFTAAGGRVLTPSDLADGEALVDRRVVVVGYGKSAADAAVASSRMARSTDMVVRTVAWKVPWELGRFRFQHLVLTRGGEFLVWAPYRSVLGRAVRVSSAPLRSAIVSRLERRIRDHQQLSRRGLDPAAPLAAMTHLTTHGFFEGVDEGRIAVHTGVTVSSVEATDDGPVVRLSDGSELHADVLVSATGYDQDIRFLGPTARAALLNGEEEVALERHTLPAGPDRLAFIGWSQSFRSPLGAEMQSLWLAAHISGLARPRRGKPHPRIYRLTHASAARRGLPLVSSGSGFLDLDEWVEESGFRVPLRVRLRELWRPIDPSDYRSFLPRLAARVQRAGGASSTGAGAGTAQPDRTPVGASD